MALIVGLVLIGGIFAGLTIGLMGLDETNLHVLMVAGSPKERIHAEKVYKLLSRGKHWVLVTLLLGNVIVNESLPVVLDSELGGGIIAILISTLLIVVFGEIIPQAVCARHGLAIGSFCSKPMLVLMYIMSPVAYPIAMLLDYWLGVHHGTTYRRTELKTLVSLHQVDGIGELTDDEVTIIASVLDLKEKAVSAVMTPLEDVFTLKDILRAGYSRIPVYRHDDAHNFIGMLLVKRLITYDPADHTPVRQFTLNSLPEAAPNTSCLDILNFFQEGRSHMAIVTSKPGGFGDPVGVITLEDVIEELLGEEIVDESDVYVDVHNKIKVIRKPSRNPSTTVTAANGATGAVPAENSSATKDTTTAGSTEGEHHVVNFKDDVEVFKPTQESAQLEEEVEGERSVVIEVPEPTGTYSINPPETVIAAVEGAEAAKVAKKPDAETPKVTEEISPIVGDSTAVITSNTPAESDTITDTKMLSTSPPSTVVPAVHEAQTPVLDPPTTEVVEPTASSSEIPKSTSTSTLLTQLSEDPPSTHGPPNKRKKKKKKSTKW
ncbi:hypothetical protein BCR41DRAFT_381492 [Lobosporangium transversale]|uniref:CNNM transmembrane domain-containing protein n=1 Tax=Lobosporangium transversale TaxID=64571 RepID=A0A1Y2GHG8_9FUNG|nr:hypothetical protein BCR41DRAFT_381492 [Lobosporangium transversale]ORZ11017.1 hypothetical protein BCR41DRAFT_381492 [Lobosporangium transversale]|eukprot:XP_021879534.1 hypothetical protein BCR41DRAFT_381492 [Lobosporangium transversale]